MATPRRSAAICAKTGFLPLTVRRGSRDHRDLPGELDAHAAPLPAARGHRLRGTKGADLDVGRDTDAEQPPGLSRGVAFGLQLVPLGERLGLGERALVVAAVEVETRRGPERKFARLREILQAQLDRIELQLEGDQIHHPLDEICSLWSSGTAVGVGGHLVRVDACDVHPHGLEFVAARQHQAGQRRDGRREQLQVRAEIGNRRRLDREKRPVVLHGHFVVANLIAAMGGRRGVVAARFNPLDRRAQAHREMRTERFFGVHVQLRSEPAANLRGDDPHLVFGDVDHAGQKRPKEMRHLRGRPERQVTFALVIGRHAAPRLDRHGRQPLVDDALLDDAVGLLEAPFHVAIRQRPREGHVGSEIGVRQRRSTGDGLFGISHRWQRLVVDLDQLGCVLRNVPIVRHDDGHGMADEIDAVAREDRVLRRLQVVHARRARHGAAAVVHVGSDEHGDHAGDGSGGVGLDRRDAGVSIGAAQDDRMQHAGQPDVVGVGRDALDEARIFETLQ